MGGAEPFVRENRVTKVFDMSSAASSPAAASAPTLAEEFITMCETDAAMAIARIKEEALDAELAGFANRISLSVYFGCSSLLSSLLEMSTGYFTETFSLY